MTTEIHWTIAALDCAHSEDGKENVIKTVHWRCDGVDGELAGSVYSTCSLPAPEVQFTAYADLTKEQVLGWIWANGVDKEATEAAVQQQIANAINPPVVTPPLPWSA